MMRVVCNNISYSKIPSHSFAFIFLWFGITTRKKEKEITLKMYKQNSFDPKNAGECVKETARSSFPFGKVVKRKKWCTLIFFQ